MEHRNKVLTTHTGFRFYVQPVTLADDGTVTDFFTHVTREDQRFRFLTTMSIVDSSEVAALPHVHHPRAENFLAFAEDGATLIAIAMLACDIAFDHGDVAITIRSDHKGKGVSQELLAHVARYVDEIGIRTLEAMESLNNPAAIKIEYDMGFTTEEYPDDARLAPVSRKHNHKPKPPVATPDEMVA